MFRRTPLPLSSVLFALLVAGGCAGGQEVTVSYNSESNRTTYKTTDYTVSSVSGSDYGSSKSIAMQAIARCQGVNCTPNRAQLVFTSEGSQRLSLSDVSGEITSDGTEITWSNAEANPDFANLSDDTIIEVTGKFAVVDLKTYQLRQIATASSLSGSIGGQPLSLGPNVQAGLRKLLEKVKQSASGGSSGTTN